MLAKCIATGIAAPYSQSRTIQSAWQSWMKWWDVGSQQQHRPAKDLGVLLKKIWEIVAPEKKLLGAAAFFMFAAATCEAMIPQLVSKSIFAVVNQHPQLTFISNLQFLLAFSVGFAVFAAVRGGLFCVLNNRINRRLRGRLFSVLTREDTTFFDQTEVGTLTSRLGTDCHAISKCIATNVNSAIRHGFQALVGGVYLFIVSKELALACGGVLVLLWAATVRYGQYSRRTQRTAQDVLADSNQVAEEVFSLHRLVRTFGTETQETDRYKEKVQILHDIGMRQAMAWALYVVTAAMTQHGSKILALLIGGLMVYQGSITPEQLTTFVLYVEFVTSSSVAVCDQYGAIMEAIGASERVLSYLEDPPSKQIGQGAVLPTVTGQVTFKDITFKYGNRGDAIALNQMNLVLAPGKLTALVGLSGSGKTTLVALLQRLYDPTEGQVLIDGHDLKDLDALWYRQQIGVVTQEPRLFSTTVAANIAYGCPGEVTRDQIQAAARSANIHDFIMSLPQGYDTLVTDKLLSGGQRQRIALARALVRNPRILILDEATSALDAESEHQVQLALDRAMQARDRTILVIAHRLSTVRSADTIVVLDSGNVAEQGTHGELIEARGIYWSLVKRQQMGISQEKPLGSPRRGQDGAPTSVRSLSPDTLAGSVDGDRMEAVIFNDIVPMPNQKGKKTVVSSDTLVVSDSVR